MTSVASRGAMAGAGSDALDPRERAFARFDVAYEKTWPAEMGQFWADRYPACDAPYANLVHARNRRVVALCPGGGALLDVGSGYGDLLYLLRDRYRMLRGVDPSGRSCAMATYNFECRGEERDVAFVRAVAEELPFLDGMFDTVLCLDTYEHVEPAHRERAMAEFARVLRPGGTLIVVTPSGPALRALAIFDNLISLRGKLKWKKRTGGTFNMWGTEKKDYCEVFCTKRGLLRDVRRAGLRAERFERCSFYFAPERGGYFYRFFNGLPGDHPRVRGFLRVVEFFERVRVFNQKMLVVARKGAAA